MAYALVPGVKVLRYGRVRAHLPRARRSHRPLPVAPRRPLVARAAQGRSANPAPRAGPRARRWWQAADRKEYCRLPQVEQVCQHHRQAGKIPCQRKNRIYLLDELALSDVCPVLKFPKLPSPLLVSPFLVSEEKKLLVLLNPKSGPGKAREMFQQRVVPVLAEAELPYDLYVTKHANYARDFVRTKDIYQWRGVVVVGGDGIVFEVFNGMFERPDWERAVKEVPVGVIPCGSGNGLAKTIAYAMEEPYDQNPVLISTLNIVKCRSMPMDLVRVETKTQILFSFLSVGWGFLSDIDIESERLRAIGGQRFTIWSVARLIGLRTYRGKLWYLPLEGYKSQGGTPPAPAFLTRSTSHCPTLGAKGGDGLSNAHVHAHAALTPVHSSLSFHDCITPDGERNGDADAVISESLSLETALGQALDDVDAESVSEGGGSGQRPRLDSYYSATSRRSTYFSTTGSSYQSLVDSASAGGSGSEIEPRGPASSVRMYGPPSRLPALTQPAPPHWKAIDGEFVMVHASYQTHLGSDCLFAPNSKLADGIIWLLVIRAGITRAQLLQFLLGLSSGSHLTCPRAEMIPVTAFRLEPEAGTGHMTVDGELVDYGPIQAELMPSLANVMSR
ncbi:Sphingosine kinase 2 [Gryllus bimaculatus]|nr:Sphingosine kinase 2 [Gryllus bimaculatus]